MTVAVQRIRFGLALDGERGWHARDSLGESTVGPLGFLAILETQLGLTRAERSRAERIVAMRECLEGALTGSRFYEQSFKTDEFGTSATLLAWRDLWYEHGWTGEMPPGTTGRLADMAAVETLARTKVFPGTGQRLIDIGVALKVRQPQIGWIGLEDALRDLPARWRMVLSLLSAAQEAPTAPTPAAAPGTLLHDLQVEFLKMAADQRITRIPWRNDGTVRLVQAESDLAAAQWLAADMAPGVDRLVVAEQGGTTLDAALGAADQPLIGLSEPSAFRPALQILPLALRLTWSPLDFGALLQFLTHPVGPLRGFARRRLAEKMAATPGIGGESWNRVLEEIEQHYGADGPAVIADIRFWLEEARFTSAERAPLSFVLKRIARLSKLFQAGAANEDLATRAGWVAAQHQAKSVAESLEALARQGVENIGPESLDRLVSQATAAGSDNPLLRPQAGTQSSVRSPGALIEAFDDIVWWKLAAVPLPRPYPWSVQELAALRGSGVELPEPARLLEREAYAWLRPVLYARKRLTLVLPPPGEETHPAWLMLSALIEKPVIESVEDTLTAAPVPGRTSTIPFRPLPARRRWWQIPAGAIHGWDRAASYSSLEQFLHNPYQWSLNYPAQLKSSALLDLPGEFQLLGSLAHRTVEQLYRHPEALTWSAARVQQWFDTACDRIIAEEGAVLLMRGQRARREAFRLRFRRSLAALHELLLAAGTRLVEPEAELDGETPLGRLRGSSDLLLTLGDGARAVIDMKWAGNKKYREKLKDQTHIQLAIYARLVEQNSSRWPSVAYFILSDPELLTTAEGVFPDVTPIRVEGTSTALLWERLSTTWAWRRKQIESGLVEVVFEDIEATDASAAPEGALPIEALDERYNPFLTLAGWGPEA